MMVRAVLGVVIVGLLMVPCVFAATNYSSMSDDQFRQMRSSINTASPEEQQAYSEEWYKRYENQPLQQQMWMREKKFGLAPGETTGEMMKQPLPPPSQQAQLGQPSSQQPAAQTYGQQSQAPTSQSEAMAARKYRSMSNEQLQSLMTPQGMAPLTPGERQALRQEWETRIASMTAPERQRYMLSPRKDTVGAPSSTAGTQNIESRDLRTDYSDFTNRELMSMRDIIRDATPQQQQAFWAEWQSRGLPMGGQGTTQYGTTR